MLVKVMILTLLSKKLKCGRCFSAGRGSETQPAGDHAAEVPAARRGEHHSGCGQAAAGGEEGEAHGRRVLSFIIRSEPCMYLFVSSSLCVFPAAPPQSSSAVVVTAPQTGQEVCGSRQRRTNGWFLTAAVKLPVTTVASGTIHLISTRWR